VYLFQIAGLVLLVAMVGAIVLTLRQRSDVRRQSIRRQTERRRGDSVEIRNVPTGSGVGS
jgi:NADH-quinone oxidoreductase subunit J